MLSTQSVQNAERDSLYRCIGYINLEKQVHDLKNIFHWFKVDLNREGNTDALFKVFVYTVRMLKEHFLLPRLW